MKKVRKHVIKLISAVGLALAALFAFNAVSGSLYQTASAATPSVVRVNYRGWSIAVWNNYENGAFTGQYLANGTSWKVIRTATNSKGEIWYDLGANQWVPSAYVTDAAQAVSQAPSSAEAVAKAWIANRESGGSYTARNGIYYGKYQLTISYLGGNLSPANQERVADNYVKSRYGSWVIAKNFWISHGWY